MVKQLDQMEFIINAFSKIIEQMDNEKDSLIVFFSSEGEMHNGEKVGKWKLINGNGNVYEGYYKED
jgi:hypothetical protein